MLPVLLYLQLAISLLIVLWGIGMLAFMVYIAYIQLTSGSLRDVPEWLFYWLGGVFFILNVSSTVINTVTDIWQYGHLKLGRVLSLMLWVFVLGVYFGIRLAV